MEEDYREKRYNEIFTNPFNWLRNANEHFYSAEVLRREIQELDKGDRLRFIEESPSLLQSYNLLIGIALENVLKGYIIACERERKSNEELKKYIFKIGHNLPKYFETYCNDLYTYHKELIHRSKEFIIWKGKYIINKEPKYHKTISSHSYNDLTNARYIHKEVYKRVENIEYDNLQNKSQDKP